MSFSKICIDTSVSLSYPPFAKGEDRFFFCLKFFGIEIPRLVSSPLYAERSRSTGGVRGGTKIINKIP
jgi:hypothetical protein